MRPLLRARFRVAPEDFRVDEELGFAADGEGEHLLLRVQKTGANTEWVAQRLAAFVGVGPEAVGYAGLKDRHAVTTQSFSVHLPGRADPDFSTLPAEGVRVLEVARHRRKLPRGALRGNRFEVVLRDVAGDRNAIEERLHTLAQSGFPNYFGDQRFGRDGGNIAAAERWFRHGGRLTRTRRSLLLSSARSALFNAVLTERIADGSWQRLLPGDVAVLAGSRSWFPVGDPPPADLDARLASGDVHPSGPLWGRGSLPSSSQVAALEHRVVHAHGGLAAGLEAAGLKQDRRALRAMAADLAWSFESETTLRLACRLDAGVYMTSLLAALGEVEDAAAISR
ncbi:MAG TPA: tRNA pseudouridine(13) synthase TruD [Xanthomonadaceae bacterium]|nr:tRNA pseudouridine(13) synthase TruD [Xanthomonadaceae bacterium]